MRQSVAHVVLAVGIANARTVSKRGEETQPLYIIALHAANMIRNKQECKRRVVAYSGPSKTGSSSLQKFFQSHFGIDDKNADLRVFNPEWKYPFQYSWHYCHEKPVNRTIQDNVTVTTLDRAAKSMKPGENMFMACESISWRQPNDRYYVDFFNRLEVDPACAEFILHFRTPRIDHWLSFYNQLARNRKVPGAFTDEHPLQRFVCNGNKYAVHIIKEIDSLRWAHERRMTREMDSPRPFHSGQASKTNIVAVDWPIHIIDMAGVAAAGHDITDVTACDILGMNCTDDGWIVGAKRARPVENTRSQKVKEDLTDIQRESLDLLFRLRDCTYRNDLHNDPMVHILYRQDTMWSNCAEGVNYGSLPSFLQLRNETFFLHAMQSVMGCDESRPYDEFEAMLTVPNLLSTTGANIDTTNIKLRVTMMSSAYLVYFAWVVIVGFLIIIRRVHKSRGRAITLPTPPSGSY